MKTIINEDGIVWLGLSITTNEMNTTKEITMNAHIIAGALAAGGTNLIPCIKQTVCAMLVTVEGKEFFGANWMINLGVTVCPRVEAKSKSGEDYHFC